MPVPLHDASSQTCDAIREAILNAIKDAQVEVSGHGNHFTLKVISAAFADKSMLQQQRLVYAAITPLMSGDNAPVHAIDHMETQIP